MGHGRTPGSESAAPPDAGTSATTLAPTPGATGLDSRDAPPKPAAADLSEAVVAFGRRSRGKKVGDGECFALAHRALRSAGAKSAEDFGAVTPTADYTWGAAVSLANLKPGDIAQFRDYRYHQRIDTVSPDGSEKWEERSEERPHHTAIVEAVGASGAVMVLEQNAPEGSAVRRTQVYFSTETIRDGGTTTTTTVEGSVRFYRPQVR